MRMATSWPRAGSGGAGGAWQLNICKASERNRSCPCWLAPDKGPADVREKVHVIVSVCFSCLPFSRFEVEMKMRWNPNFVDANKSELHLPTCLPESSTLGKARPHETCIVRGHMLKEQATAGACRDLLDPCTRIGAPSSVESSAKVPR